ncbi:hypothetical protein HOD30_00110 [Candidatus Peregrinibacteria bacterium]|jgi:hypothetical protein|nr:hypothetical protein [Candidatus Peregrinibacteria bacterium]MBT4632406.1 hypothetical protein [Candidatus Peregrinibacteria bacterium]MBT5823609.1 hypothetical protein [Candidatus Peregrinibacteria bacterium]
MATQHEQKSFTDPTAFVGSLVDILNVDDVEDYSAALDTVAGQLEGLTSQGLQSLVPVIEARMQSMEAVQLNLQVREGTQPFRAKIAAALAKVSSKPKFEEEYHDNEMRLDNLRHLLDMVRGDIESAEFDEERQAQDAQFAKERLVSEELSTDLHRLVLFGDENVAPTEDGWGIIIVDRSLGEDEMRTFIQANEAAALQRTREVDDILGRVDDPTFDRDATFCVYGAANFNAYTMEKMIRSKGNLDDMPTLDEVTTRMAAIEEAIQGNFSELIDRLPYPQCSVVVGLYSDTSFANASYWLTVDINKSVEDNIAFVASVLGRQNPEEVEEFLVGQGSQAKTAENMQRQLLDYACAMTCKEVDIPWFAVDKGAESQTPAADSRRAGGIVLFVDENASPEQATQFIRDHAEEWKRLDADHRASLAG